MQSRSTGIQYPAASSLQRVYDDVIPYTHIRKTQEHFYCVFKNNEDIFLHYFWYTLLLIETRSLAVHDDFDIYDNCAQPNTQS